MQLVVNDITNSQTFKKSADELKKSGLISAMEPYKASGIVYFFDAKTKKPLAQITMANSDEEFLHTITEVKKSLN